MERLYYSIGEVAAMYNVKTSVIRFWENTYSELKPVRNKKGNRMFTDKDLEIISVIHHLTKERGMTHEGVMKKLKENKDGSVKHVEIVRKLQDIRQTLVKIQNSLKCEPKIE